MIIAVSCAIGGVTSMIVNLKVSLDVLFITNYSKIIGTLSGKHHVKLISCVLQVFGTPSETPTKGLSTHIAIIDLLIACGSRSLIYSQDITVYF